MADPGWRNSPWAAGQPTGPAALPASPEGRPAPGGELQVCFPSLSSWSQGGGSVSSVFPQLSPARVPPAVLSSHVLWWEWWCSPWPTRLVLWLIHRVSLTHTLMYCYLCKDQHPPTRPEPNHPQLTPWLQLAIPNLPPDSDSKLQSHKLWRQIQIFWFYGSSWGFCHHLPLLEKIENNVLHHLTGVLVFSCLFNDSTAWKSITSGDFTIRLLHGSHFYLKDSGNEKVLLDYITKQLETSEMDYL